MTDLSALTQYAVVAFASLFILVDPLATAPHPGTRGAGKRLLRTNGPALPAAPAGGAASRHCRPIYLARRGRDRDTSVAPAPVGR
jgi:hypothetical protein